MLFYQTVNRHSRRRGARKKEGYRLFAIGVARPFLDHFLRRAAAAVVVPAVRRAAIPVVLFVVIFGLLLFRDSCGPLRSLRVDLLLLRVAPVMVVPAPAEPGAVAPVVSPLPGSVALLRLGGLLPGLLLRCRR